MRFKRIVVALDGSPTSLAALEATAELAAVWGAEVVGLFVEDSNLLRMASLPFAREVGTHSGAHRAINPDQFEREFRSQAGRARATLWFVAERMRLTASFKVCRGPIKAELMKALAEADMLAMGKGGQSVAASLGLGTNAKSVAGDASGVVLLFSHVAQVSGPPAVVYGGTQIGDRALTTAGELATTLGTPLIVLVPMDLELERETIEAEARNAVARQPVHMEFRRIAIRNVPELARSVRSSGANLAVVPTGTELLTPAAIETLLSRFSGPVMLVREGVETN